MYRIYTILLLSLFTLTCFSQNSYTISGYVQDNESGENLIGVSIYDKATFKGTSTNQYGFYSLTLEEGKYDAALGGARRDEEKARAKERFFSHRDDFGQWDPKNQRPELWNIFNGRKHLGEHFRVFPISNWTEMDIWQYIYLENRHYLYQQYLLLSTIYYLQQFRQIR